MHATDRLISRNRVSRWLTVVVILTIVASALGELSRAYPGSVHPLVGLLRFLRSGFNPSAEQTMNTWLASMLLLGCALLLLAISAALRERAWAPWRVLGSLFVFLSVDEMISIHERVGDLVSDRIETSGYFLWAWVIPYGILALVIAISYVPFVWRLPPDTRWRVILAGAIYVGGALGVEMIEAQIVTEAGSGTRDVAILAVVEEGLELAGAALFFTVLLRHIARYLPIEVGLRQ